MSTEDPPQTTFHQGKRSSSRSSDSGFGKYATSASIQKDAGRYISRASVGRMVGPPGVVAAGPIVSSGRYARQKLSVNADVHLGEDISLNAPSLIDNDAVATTRGDKYLSSSPEEGGHAGQSHIGRIRKDAPVNTAPCDVNDSIKSGSKYDQYTYDAPATSTHSSSHEAIMSTKKPTSAEQADNHLTEELTDGSRHKVQPRVSVTPTEAPVGAIAASGKYSVPRSQRAGAPLAPSSTSTDQPSASDRDVSTGGGNNAKGSATSISSLSDSINGKLSWKLAGSTQPKAEVPLPPRPAESKIRAACVLPPPASVLPKVEDPLPPRPEESKIRAACVLPPPASVLPKVEEPLLPYSEESKDKVAHLSVAERKLTTVYFKMLKLGIPPQSIVQKMSLDGLPIDLSRRVMLEMGAAHLISDSADKISSDSLRDATLSSKKKLLRLHWKPLSAENLSTSSLWSNSLGEELNVAPDSEELSEIEKLFGVVPSKVLPPVPTAATSKSLRHKGDPHHMPVVLDMQRCTNISIGLAYYKDVGSMRCILNALCSLNNMKKRLTVDRLLNLSVMLPHLSEARALQGVETANKAEMFCKLAMEYYPHLAGRLSCFLTMSQFAEIQQSVIPKMQLYVKALDDIMQSKRLALILNKMLYIGNTLNAGTSIGAAVGFSLSSLSYAMTLRGGADRKISVVDFAVRSLREKGHTDILQVVEDIKLVEDLAHLTTAAITNDATEAENEYADLVEQLKTAEDYLLFYYQGALESWIKAESGENPVIKEEDLVNTPYGPGTVKEVRSNGMLKVRPLKWHLQDEVVHTMIIHKDVVSIRAPFVAGDVVDTHHGAGVVVEVRPSDCVAVIRPLTWSMSAMSIPLIYEPIVGLRPLHDPARQNAMPSSESDLPKLTLAFVSTLKAFMKTSNEKMSEMKRLKELMIRKIGDVGKYFGECEESFNLMEMVNILRQFRKSLQPMYEAEVRAAAALKMREDRARALAEKAALEAARAAAAHASPPPQKLPTPTESSSSSCTAFASPSPQFVDVGSDDTSDSESESSCESLTSDIAEYDPASYEKWLRHYYNDISNQSTVAVPDSSGTVQVRRIKCIMTL